MSSAPPLQAGASDDAPAETPKRRSCFQLIAVLTGLYLSLFLVALDQSIVATAVPVIVSDLASSSGYVWIGSAYLLATAAAGPVWTNLSDIWGRKLIILAAVALFFVGSLICALAINMPMLIAGRALQGVAGGGLVQMVHVTISDMFSVRSRSLYLGLLELMWAVAGGVGPVIGGAFTQLVSWRWCFWINLPLSFFTFMALLIFLDVHNPKTSALEGFRAVDWGGIVSILSFTCMLLIGLQLGGTSFPWKSPLVICLIIAGIVMLVFFVLSEERARYPLIPLDLLKNVSNLASLLVVFFHGMVYIAQEYYLPLYFQSALSESPFRSGLLVLPVSLTEALAGIVCGIIIHRTGKYLEITYVGCVIMTVGAGLYITFSKSTTIAKIIGIEIVGGIGAGCLFEPPLIALQAFTSQEKTAAVTSTFGFVRPFAQSLSLVLGLVIFQNSMSLQIPGLEAAGIPSSVTSLLSDGEAAANVMIVSALPDARDRGVVADAFVWSLRNMWIMYTCFSAMAGVASVFIGKKKLSKEHVETITGLREKDVVAN
ncbi:MFS transporter-3 [Coleophoma crateriformis]|uniref:MFS transporter-3 n=1 Tax=Coleophoma crateriformis TaxID=565419 RepID=A0A3D8T254_9HELO|nr:MFS transporter-3 [Coleophoma crateriformis]